MAPNQGSNRATRAPAEDLRHRLDAIDVSLLDHIEGDERFESGVPSTQRSSDLDFVQMAGLTRPEAPDSAPATPTETAEVPLYAPYVPLDFYEQGVADVDAAMAPPVPEDTALADDDIVPMPRRAPDPPPAPRAVPPPDHELEDMLTRLAAPPLVSWEDAVDEEPGIPQADMAAFDAESSSEKPPGGIAQPLPVELDEVSALLKELAPQDVAAAPVAKLPPPPVLTPPRPESRPHEPTGVPDLAEAEQLLQALENQPREQPLDTPPQPFDDGAEPSRDLEESGERDASVYRQPPTKPHRRSPRRGRTLRRVLRWGLRLTPIVVLVAAGTVAYVWTRPLLAAPGQSLDEANRLKTQGRYAEAADRYLRFVAASPNHPEKAEAQFQAAFCTQLIPSESFDQTQANHARGLELLRQFVADNPAHAKVPRAEIRMAVLDFELGHYPEAVEILQDPSWRLRDPESAAPALRTLARARWKLGEYDAAESAYLQAAALSENVMADQDYEELGDVFRWRGDHADSPADSRRFRETATQYWDKAMRVPTIDPANKAKIKTKRDWLQNKLDEEKLRVPAETAPAPAAETTAAPAAGTPAPVDPRLEAQYPRAPSAATPGEAPKAPSGS